MTQAAAIFASGFFENSAVQTALIVGGVVAIVSAIIGTFTVMRGQSFAGHSLSDIAVEHGVAVLLSAHDINPLLPVMDRVIYLADGRAATGTTEQVIRTETLSELYRHQVEVIRVQDRILVVAGQRHADDGLSPDLLVGTP